MSSKLTNSGLAAMEAETLDQDGRHGGASSRLGGRLNQFSSAEHAVADLFKHLLTRIGGYLSKRATHSLNSSLNYLEVGRWMREKGYRPRHVFSRKQQFWNLIGWEIGNRKVLYLEFGVWRGDATREVAKVLRHPECELHGFDSFEGLPEPWNSAVDQGCFSTGGDLPRIADPRVHFHKGWFEHTLPTFSLPSHDVLLINCDADLYSSTIFVLNQLRNAIGSESYLYFDEFSDRNHELRAFDEFLARTGMKFQLLAATRSFDKVLFKCEECGPPASSQ